MKAEIKSNSELDVKRPEPGIYAGVPFGKYCRLDAENQTTLKSILVSPLHYREAKKKNAERDSVALRDGRIVHSMVLEAGAVASRVAVWPKERRGKLWDAVAIRHEGGTLAENFAVFDGKVRNGKAWEAFRAEMKENKDTRDVLLEKEMEQVEEFVMANDSGRTPFEEREIVTETEWEKLKEMGGAVKGHQLFDPLRKRRTEATKEANNQAESHRELTLVWVEITDDGDVMCKARLDDVSIDLQGQVTVNDLKTTRAKTQREFERAVVDYGYDFQREWYCRGWDRLTGEYVSADRFRFLTVQNAAPWDVNDYALPEIAIHAGRYLVDQALERLTACRKSDKWPGLNDDEPVTLNGYRPRMPGDKDVLDMLEGMEAAENLEAAA